MTVSQGRTDAAVVLAYPDIQQGMIGLPEIVGLFGLVPVEEIIGGPVGFTAFVSQHNQGGVKLLNDAIHPFNWLRVLDTAERAQVDQRVRQQLHAIVPLLDAFKAE